MQISEENFLFLLKELMITEGGEPSAIEDVFTAFRTDRIGLMNVALAAAAQCFLTQHSSSNADVLRDYFREIIGTGKITFSKNDTLS